ncbi:MAG: hypothetical protein JWN40_5210 [Phycisphaerales bacterium]|nr:hypothetical protein [Phycisphaerales bacterium]
MSCEAVQQTVTDLGFDPATRQRVVEALAHLETCASCRAVVGDCDRIAALLNSTGADDEGVPPAGWDAFEAALLKTSTAATVDRTPARRWSRMTLAVAASLVIGLMGLIAGLSAWLKVNPNGTAPGAGMATLTTAEVSQRTREFTEINRAFDGRAGWVLLAGGQSDLGLAETASAIDLRPLVLRLNLSREGRVVAEADVLIVPGQTADLTIPTISGGSLRCRLATSASDQSALSLRAELRAGARQETEALMTTNLRLRGNTTVPAGQLVTRDGEYDLRVLFALPSRNAEKL